MTDATAGMTRLVDSAHMQEIDRRAQEEYGIPSIVLMESAGLFAWLELKHRLEERFGGSQPSICVVAGKGNNGGDALVMARYAIGEGYDTTVVLAAGRDELGEHAGVHARIVAALGAEVLVWKERTQACRDAIRGTNVVVDGLAGTGIKGALRPPLDAICDAMNVARAPVATVDAPSGLSDSWRSDMPAVEATWTLTMGVPKNCLYTPLARAKCGEIVRIPVSFPRELIVDPSIRGVVLEPDRLSALLPPLSPVAYKHKRGVVGVFAGAMGTTGAAVLAAEGAHRCRAGLVTVFADEAVYPIVASNVGSVMVRPLQPEAPLGGVDLDAVVVGPGWGVTEERAALLRTIVDTGPGGAIDADGLNLLATMDEPPALSVRWVLTPHPGEMARLLGTDGRTVLEEFLPSALRLAKERGAVVVGKSHTTIVAHPDGRYAYADGMNAAMATGGSGDVLAGAIAGLVAGGMDGWQAACAAVLAHQIAGQSLRERAGLFLAEELAVELGMVADVARRSLE